MVEFGLNDIAANVPLVILLVLCFLLGRAAIFWLKKTYESIDGIKTNVNEMKIEMHDALSDISTISGRQSENERRLREIEVNSSDHNSMLLVHDEIINDNKQRICNIEKKLESKVKKSK
jgi:hypothetical protein